EFAMKLEPDMLGELTVKMVMEQGRLSVSIAAANGQTAKLIEGQMTELRAALKENNIQMETCTVENQSYNDLASGGSFSMFGGQTDDRPQRTQRLVIEKIPEEQQNAIEQLNVMRATSILNCYV
ncbi:MAG: flagellar hook-length control protein FliK, partial [Acetanaerobacterium sp.]